ncbi:MAG TPA: SDR family oxidoreductase [Flavipsychrobacter sp.]|nr:SDR family oxidoreductase [Flavipsychrobacter sp.]
MQLKNKIAVIYGAGGAIGSTVARTFASEGAKVYLTGRSLEVLEAVQKKIILAGGKAEIARVDALNEQEINAHMKALIAREGKVDITFNAIAIPQTGIQGVPLLELPIENFNLPIKTYTMSHLLTARAAAHNMIEKGSGVILSITAIPSSIAAPFVGGMAPSWAALESLNRMLSAELGRFGVRAICIRADGIPETETITEVYGLHAKAIGMPSHREFQGLMESFTQLKRLPKLAEVANVAVFMASDGASAMTATTINVSCGSVVD